MGDTKLSLTLVRGDHWLVLRAEIKQPVLAILDLFSEGLIALTIGFFSLIFLASYAEGAMKSPANATIFLLGFFVAVAILVPFGISSTYLFGGSALALSEEEHASQLVQLEHLTRWMPKEDENRVCLRAYIFAEIKQGYPARTTSSDLEGYLFHFLRGEHQERTRDIDHPVPTEEDDKKLAKSCSVKLTTSKNIPHS